MAYPFLPVNPCCTDVVINDFCGCNSVITNTGCNNNNPCSTNLTASSTIIYNGPALSCTTAEPCDTLNVVLQKIDEIICNLLTQINLLTIQVENINEQLLIIENNIININDQLTDCCGVTTTTTTTLVPCECLTFENIGITSHSFIYSDCLGNLVETQKIYPEQIIKVCGCCGFTSSPDVTISVGDNCIDGVCPPTTTTTTTVMMVLELYGCCDETTQYVEYTPILASIPGVYTATNGQPYEVISDIPVVGIPTVFIDDITNYENCVNWVEVFINCP